MSLVDRRLSQMTEGDMVGLPSVDGGVTRFNPPNWFKLCCDQACVLLLDELNRATNEVMQAAFQIVLDRELNGFKLHPGTRVIACVNNSAEYIVNEIDPALLDRFFVTDIEVDVNEWLAWGREKNEATGLTNISDLVADFVSTQPSALMPTKIEMGKVAPSPRSWDRVSQVQRAMKIESKPEDPNFYAVAAGFLGPDVATAFQSFATQNDNRVSVEDVLDRGLDAKVLKRIDKLSTEARLNLAMSLYEWIRDHDVEEFTEERGKNTSGLYKRLDPESRVLFHQRVMSVTEVENGVKNIPKVVMMHKNNVRLFLEVFGMKPGKEGIGMTPTIPDFVKKSLRMKKRTKRIPSKLIEWLASREFELVRARVSSVIPGCFTSAACSWDPEQGNVVVIDPRLDHEKAVSFLIHEMGHIHCAWIGREYPDGVDACPTSRKTGFPILSKRVKPTQHSFEVLREEMEAWQEGEAIAKSLKVRLPDSHVETRAKAFATYIAYAAYRLRMRPLGWEKNRKQQCNDVSAVVQQN